ncbi:MAG: hypothetical protein ABIQ54_05340 [Gammaproteobacteria bacterium]
MTTQPWQPAQKSAAIARNHAGKWRAWPKVSPRQPGFLPAPPLRVMRYWFYVWAFPPSCLGLLFIPFAWLSGGRSHIVSGVIEVHGGFLARLFTVKYGAHGWAAITLGHVVLGRDQGCLESTREHERVHVRQYERWGLFFIPAYLLAGLYVWLRGGNPYLDNPFEREAYGWRANNQHQRR